MPANAAMASSDDAVTHHDALDGHVFARSAVRALVVDTQSSRKDDQASLSLDELFGKRPAGRLTRGIPTLNGRNELMRSPGRPIFCLSRK